MSGRTLNGLSSLANDVLGSCLIKQNNLIDLSDKQLACVNLGFTGNIPSVYKNATTNATPNTLVAYNQYGGITSSSLSAILPGGNASVETTVGFGNNDNRWAGIFLNGDGPTASKIVIYSTSDIYGGGNFLVKNNTTQKVLFMSDPSGNFKICPTGTLGMLDNANMTITSPVIMNDNTKTIYCNSFNTYENRNTQTDATYNIDFNNNLLINIATLTSGSLKTNSITTTLPDGTNISFNSKNLTSVGAITCTSISGNGSGLTSFTASQIPTTLNDTTFANITLTSSSSSTGPAFDFISTATGGRRYRMISTSGGNAGGAGILQIYDQTGSRTMVDIKGATSEFNFNNNTLKSINAIECATLTGSTSVSTPSITTTGSSINFNTKDLTSVGSISCSGTVSARNIWRTIWNQQSTQMIAPTTYTASSSATSIDTIRFSATFTYYRETKCVYQAVFKNLIIPMVIVMEIYSIVLAPLSVSATPLLSAQTYVPGTGGSRSIVIPITSGVDLQPGQQYIVVFKDRYGADGLNYSVIGAEIVLGSGS